MGQGTAPGLFLESVRLKLLPGHKRTRLVLQFEGVAGLETKLFSKLARNLDVTNMPELRSREKANGWRMLFKTGRLDRLHSGFHDFQSADVTELAGVECGHGPAALQRSGGDDQVVGTDHLAGGGELSPDSCVCTGHSRVHGDDFQAPKELLNPASASPGARYVLLDLDAEPQFAEGDDADCDRFRRARMKPGRQVEALAFVGDQQ